MLPYQLRPMERAIDEDFIYSTYLRSYRHSPEGRSIPHDIYYRGCRKRLGHLLAIGRVTIAHPPEASEMILGWTLTGGSNILHYIYVKGNYRGQGIGKGLLHNTLDWQLPLFYTHRGTEIWIPNKLKTDPQCLNYYYNPFLLEGLNGDNHEEAR